MLPLEAMLVCMVCCCPPEVMLISVVGITTKGHAGILGPCGYVDVCGLCCHQTMMNSMAHEVIGDHVIDYGPCSLGKPFGSSWFVLPLLLWVRKHLLVWYR